MPIKFKDRVKETTTTEGTGDITLLGAADGYSAFYPALSVGDTFYYAIELNLEWEVGIGTLSTTTSFARTTVIASSNGGAATVFSAGTKTVFVTVASTYFTGGRERLSGVRTYYVRTDGADTNNGLTNTAGGAFLTVQKAIDAVVSTIDTAGYTVTIQLADGTYASGGNLYSALVGGGLLEIVGNATTPANVIMQGTFASRCMARLVVRNMDMTYTGGGSIISADYYGYIGFSGLIISGYATYYHIKTLSGGMVEVLGAYTLAAGAGAAHMWVGMSGLIYSYAAMTVTISGTPNIGTYVAVGAGGNVSHRSCTFSGSVTGVRYSVVAGGIIDCNAGGVNYFPGSVAGSTATGGVYA